MDTHTARGGRENLPSTVLLVNNSTICGTREGNAKLTFSQMLTKFLFTALIVQLTLVEFMSLELSSRVSIDEQNTHFELKYANYIQHGSNSTK